MGRSNRVDPEAPKFGCLLTPKNTLNQENFELNLKEQENQGYLLRDDHLYSLEVISKHLEIHGNHKQSLSALIKLKKGYSKE